jgi:hypothetical protein
MRFSGRGDIYVGRVVYSLTLDIGNSLAEIAARDARMKSQREWSRIRRERNRANGDCINETLDDTHGKATHGVRCSKCHEAHRRSR